MIFKKHFSFLARHQCISVTRSSQKEGKSSRKLRFLRISCKRKLLEHVLKIKISKKIKSECSEVRSSHYFSRKSCVGTAEFSRETVFYKIKYFVLGNGKCLFMTGIRENFHFLKKDTVFLGCESFASTGGFSILPKQPILGNFELGFRIWSKSKNVPDRGGGSCKLTIWTNR